MEQKQSILETINEYIELAKQEPLSKDYIRDSLREATSLTEEEREQVIDSISSDDNIEFVGYGMTGAELYLHKEVADKATIIKNISGTVLHIHELAEESGFGGYDKDCDKCNLEEEEE